MRLPGYGGGSQAATSAFSRLAVGGCFFLIFLALLSAALAGRYQIAFNASSSVGSKVLLLRLTTAEQYALGSIVAFAFDGSQWGFPAGTPWAKRVVGIAGETVQVAGDAVLVGGRPVAMLHQPMMESQRLSAASEGVIPQGYLFVAGEHERSFDSRYREFGLIPVSAVFGRAIAAM